MNYLIQNVHILTMNDSLDVYPGGSIAIEGDTIREVGDTGNRYRDFHRIDGRGAIAVPGLINAHTHAGMIPFRSLGDGYRDRLRRFLFPLELNAMTAELAYQSARYASAEMLLGEPGI